MTQPQLEASASEAGKGGAVSNGLVLLQQRGPGMVPALSCPCHCLLAGRSLAGLGEASLQNHLGNTSPSPRLRQVPLVGTEEEECEMSKAQTLARAAPDARLGGISPFPALPTGTPTRAWCAPSG